MAATPLTSLGTPEVDFSDGAAFVNGDYAPVSEAKISVFDFGFTRSDVTYDVVSVWNGRFFSSRASSDPFRELLSVFATRASTHA